MTYLIVKPCKNYIVSIKLKYSECAILAFDESQSDIKYIFEHIFDSKTPIKNSEFPLTSNIMCWGASPTDGLVLKRLVPAKLSSAQSR